MSRLPNDGKFEHPRAKIKRAQRHLDELVAAVADFQTQNPVEWIKEAAPEGGVQFRFESTEGIGSPAPEFSAIVGDILHNLRASLDLCACELARLNGESDASVYFPFCDTPDYLDEMIKKRNFHRAGPSAVDYVRTLKPYKGGNKLLRAIHDLDVEDKHRSLVVVSPLITSPMFSLGPNSEPIGTRFAGTVQLLFPDGSDLDRHPLIETLHEMVRTTECIVEAFAALHTP